MGDLFDVELFRDAAKQFDRQDQSPEMKAAVERFNQLIEDIANKRLDRTEAFRKMEAIERDFAFLVDAKVAAGDIVRAAKGADRILIESVSVFDVYAGKGVPQGKKSLAIAVTLQPVERTLTDGEIEAVSNKIVAQVTKATGAVLRG